MSKASPKEIKRLEDLQPDPANPNRGSERGAYMIDWSLTELGAARSLVADRSGTVLCGNKTLEAAVSHGFPVRVVQTTGEELVVVQRMDLDLNGTDAQRNKARQVSIVDNRSSEVGYVQDTEQLLAHMQSGVDISPMFLEDEIKALLDSLTPEIEPGGGGDEFDATPVDGPTRCQVGDLWVIGGKHRLLCGDSTKAEDVARLMGGEKAEIMVTDPPYGVDYEGVTNDDAAGLVPLLEAAFRGADSVLQNGACYYICHPDIHAYEFIGVVRSLGWTQARPPVVLWIKDRLVLGRGDYHSQSEPILYGWKGGAGHHQLADRSQSNVWNFSRPSSAEGHPTMKPVDLFGRAIANSSSVGATVYDPFLGSGTTLIAAHREGRVCYGLEIEPKYCDVILKRAEAEGLSAEKSVNG